MSCCEEVGNQMIAYFFMGAEKITMFLYVI